jgi:hypothetical protein
VRRGGPREHPGSAEGTAAEPSGGTRRYSAGAALRRRVESQGARHFALSAYTRARPCRQRRCSLWCAATVPSRGTRTVMRCAAAVATMQRLQRLQRFIKRKSVFVCSRARVLRPCVCARARMRACVQGASAIAYARWPSSRRRRPAGECLSARLTARRSPSPPPRHAQAGAIRAQRRTSGGGL